MMKKTIAKIVIYYDNGTYEEVTPSVHNSQNQQDKKDVGKSPVIPDFRPDVQKMREWSPSTPYQPVWIAPNTGDPSLPPWTITCDTASMTTSYSLTSTGNGFASDKYTITSTGNGINVDLSK